MAPFEYWFTSTTVTLWVAVVAAILSLMVAIRGDWQTAEKEQTRIAAEKAVQESRQKTLGVILDVSTKADQLAYTRTDQDHYDNWKSQADEFWSSAQQRLKPILPLAEFINMFAPANPSALSLGHAVNDDHNDYMIKLTELAARLRSLALKYA